MFPEPEKDTKAINDNMRAIVGECLKHPEATRFRFGITNSGYINTSSQMPYLGQIQYVDAFYNVTQLGSAATLYPLNRRIEYTVCIHPYDNSIYFGIYGNPNTDLSNKFGLYSKILNLQNDPTIDTLLFQESNRILQEGYVPMDYQPLINDCITEPWQYNSSDYFAWTSNTRNFTMTNCAPLRLPYVILNMNRNLTKNELFLNIYHFNYLNAVDVYNSAIELLNYDLSQSYGSF